MTRYPEGPEASPGFLLWRVTLSWQRDVAEALRPFGLTHAQFVILACAWWMGEHGRSPRQHELASQAGTDSMMTSQVIRRLEGRGLVERKVDPEDSRAKLVIVTPLGVSLVPRAVRSVEEVDSSYFPDPTSALVGELQRIARAKEL